MYHINKAQGHQNISHYFIILKYLDSDVI